MGQLEDWLLPGSARTPRVPSTKASDTYAVPYESIGSPCVLSADDADILTYLYRNSSSLMVRPLTGTLFGCFAAGSAVSYLLLSEQVVIPIAVSI